MFENKDEENRNKTIYTIAGAVVILLILILTATYPGQKDRTEKLKSEILFKPAQEIYLSVEKSNNYNPLNSDMKNIDEINGILYSGLFSIDRDQGLKPELTESYETNSNNGSVKIKLRTDAKFSDGSVMNSEDIKYTVEQIKEAGEGSPYFKYADKIDSVDVMGDSLFIINFKSEEDASLYNLVFPIVCADDFSLKKDFPASCGKYKMDKCSKKGMIFETDKYYYGIKGGKTLEFTFVDGNKDIEKMLDGEKITAFFTENMDMVDKAEKKGYRVTPIISDHLEYIGFNCSDGLFEDSRFRSAFSESIDRMNIIDEVFDGGGTVADSLVYPGFSGNNEKRRETICDPSALMETLDKGGYRNVDKDGFRTSRDGSPLKIRILVNSSIPGRIEMAQNISSQIEKAGVRTDISAAPESDYTDALKAGNFDIFIDGKTIDSLSDITDLTVNENYTGFDDENLEEMASSLEECISIDSVKEKCIDIGDTLEYERPYFPICYRNSYFVTVDTFKSSGNHSYRDPYANVETWKWERKEEKN